MNAGPVQPRIRNTPHLPHAKDVEPAPATLMYWSRAPVYGVLPQHGVRAHSVTLVDNVAWLFGGCDEKGCWRDIYLFNTGTRVRRIHMNDTPDQGCRNDAVEPSTNAWRRSAALSRTYRNPG